MASDHNMDLNKNVYKSKILLNYSTSSSRSKSA